MEKKIKFLIEQDKDTGLPVFDFQYELINAVKHVNWLFPDQNEYEYELVSRLPMSLPKDYSIVPVGCVDFVRQYIKKFYNIEPKPLNIPEVLCTPEFVKREIFLYNPTTSSPTLICSTDGCGRSKPVDSKIGQRYFIKSNDKIKDYSGFEKLEDLPLKDQWYFVSEIIPDIDSEFRCFVYRDELIDVRQYAGDTANYYNHPRLDINLVKKIIAAYKGHSPAYTLDMGTHQRRGSFIIELHNFWSCGLYGFAQYPKLLRMTVGGFCSEIKKTIK